jgi:mRNA interferase RelE/StbE
MKTEYKPTFVKDLKRLKSTENFQQIKRLIFEEIPSIETLDEIINLKRLRGNENAYRIRVGDYRIGFLLEGDTISFQRVLHRREIYRYFP